MELANASQASKGRIVPKKFAAACRFAPLSFVVQAWTGCGHLDIDPPPACEGNQPETPNMRFLSMIRINENSGLKPSEQLMTDMGKLIDEMTKAGTLLETAGLRPTEEGVRVRLAHGKLTLTDGPFTETKEVIGGYAMLRADSMDEAVECTKRFLRVHGDEWDVECEVRQLDEECTPKA
jgi:hypothetical protein